MAISPRLELQISHHSYDSIISCTNCERHPSPIKTSHIMCRCGPGESRGLFNNAVFKLFGRLSSSARSYQ